VTHFLTFICFDPVIFRLYSGYIPVINRLEPLLYRSYKVLRYNRASQVTLGDGGKLSTR
jgi:hypothetical protein